MRRSLRISSKSSEGLRGDGQGGGSLMDVDVAATRSKSVAKNKKESVPTVREMKKRKNKKFKVAYTNRKGTKKHSSQGDNELSLGREQLSYMTEEEKLLLSSWELPPTVLNKYQAKGVTSLFPWQLKCLENVNVLNGKNLLYSAPTSAGKTLVAEILMLKRVIDLKKKAILILPFVSVCREKMYGLQEIFGDAGIRVEGFMGTYSPPGGFKAVDIAICTIEKANSLINRLLEEKSLSQLGTIVVDELHLIGDGHRGYLLELLLTKVRFMMKHRRELEDSQNSLKGEEPKELNIQIIGMSATLPNLNLLADWLDAELVISDYRPVPLLERICFNGKIYDPSVKPVRDVRIASLPVTIEGDDNLSYLSLETVLAGHSILIFCTTRRQCEITAKKIARDFAAIGNGSNGDPEIGEKLRQEIKRPLVQELLDQLELSPVGVDETLKGTASFGVAFHHAGLTFDERDIIEAGFKRCALRVIVATSTLSAGVNLPARRVIIDTPFKVGAPGTGKHMMDVMTYRQMCGRAGRKGVDTEGESILLCTNSSKDIGVQLVRSDLPIVRSALVGEEGKLTSSMKRALLEVIASGIAVKPSEVETYSKCTLLFKSIDAGLYYQGDLPASQQNKDHTIKECLKFLEENDFIRNVVYEGHHEYKATQLGSACLASSLAPDEGIQVYKELLKARQCFVLATDLHVVYQVTPIYLCDQLRDVNWDDYDSLLKGLSDDDLLVAKLVGVNETFILKGKMYGSFPPTMAEPLKIHLRFYAALALNDLIHEKPIVEVMNKYNLAKGLIQSFQQQASAFAGMVTAFCGKLGWATLEQILDKFQERIHFGVERQLCDLIRLSTMNAERARCLYNNGITTVAELAMSEPAIIQEILHGAGPFLSTVHGNPTDASRKIWVIGKNEGLTASEAAQQIVEEARQFIQLELGVKVLRPDSAEASGLKNTKESDSEDGEKHAEIQEKVQEPQNEFPCDNNAIANSTEKSVISNGAHNLHNSGLSRSKTVHNDVSKVSNDFVFDDSFPLFDENDIIKELAVVKQPIVEPMETSEGAAEVVVNELVGSSMDFSDLEEKQKNNNTPLRSKDELIIVYSTPERGHNSDIFARHRLSSIAGDSNPFSESSPIPNGNENSSPKYNMKTSTPKNLTETSVAAAYFDVVESDSELMHAVDKNVYSVNVEKSVRLMEPSTSGTSWDDICNQEQLKVKGANSASVQFVDQADCTNPIQKYNYKLSESDEEAMRAIANDSLFESESADLGTDAPEIVPTTTALSNAQPETITNSNSTTSSSLSAESASANLSSNLFETDTSTELSSRSSRSRSWISFGRESSRSVTTVQRFDLTYGPGKKGTVLKIIEISTFKSIPDEYFANSKMIGLELRLNDRPASANGGIGAGILRRQLQNRKYSIMLFNGGEDLWTYEWLGIMDSNRKKDICKLFKRTKEHNCCIVLFDAKTKLKRLLSTIGSELYSDIFLENKILDPMMGHKILQNEDNDDKEGGTTYQEVYDTYLSAELKKVLKPHRALNEEMKRTFFAWNVMQEMKTKLEEFQLWTYFMELEMPSIFPLLCIEINGLGVDTKEIDRMFRVLKFKALVLKIKAYVEAKRNFNLNSPAEVHNVLFREGKFRQPPGTKGTSKAVLAKLDQDLPRIIMEFRKVHNAKRLVKDFKAEAAKSLATRRIHGEHTEFTVTGRVRMAEPSLICIPRDFDLTMDFPLDEDTIEDIINRNVKNKITVRKLEKLLSEVDAVKDLCSQSQQLRSSLVSLRNVFVACCNDFVILSADYAQLELRILAQLCQDPGLLEELNGGGDLLKKMASKWYKLSEGKITNAMRQTAKEIVYGLVYGRSDYSLAENHGIDLQDAAKFKLDFMKTYPGVKSYLERTVNDCKKNEYIETISGRKRYLPNINSANKKTRAKEERRAVNFQIQGSASDLVKTAMNNIHKKLSKLYPRSCNAVNWTKYLRSGEHTSPSPNHFCFDLPKSLVCFPILNLHDELIFEVRKSHFEEISTLIKEEMENAITFSVKFPVVLKWGNSWGTLSEC